MICIHYMSQNNVRAATQIFTLTPVELAGNV